MNLFFFTCRGHCFVKVLARNLAENIVKECCWTSSLQPLYIVLIVDEFPQYLYQIPLQYIIHLGPDISLLSLCNEYHLLYYYYNFHSCCQNLEWGHENWSKNLDIIKSLFTFCGQVDFACTISHHNDELHGCTSQPLTWSGHKLDLLSSRILHLLW